MAIYDDISGAISAGGYDLTDMLHRIDVIYVSGQLTDQEREDLYSLARSNANPDDSKGELTDRVTTLETQIRELANRVATLENGGTPPAQKVLEYDENHWYTKGEQCIWQGNVYEWNLDVPGVWSPSAYPGGWLLIGEAPSDESGSSTGEQDNPEDASEG